MSSDEPKLLVRLLGIGVAQPGRPVALWTAVALAIGLVPLIFAFVIPLLVARCIEPGASTRTRPSSTRAPAVSGLRWLLAREACHR